MPVKPRNPFLTSLGQLTLSRFPARVCACLGRVLLVIACSAGLGLAGETRIILLDREPFYLPSATTIVPGQPVQWQNQSRQPHTVTHDGCRQGGSCAFASKHLHPGERFDVKGLPPGLYAYHCEIHPFMRGRIHVKPVARHNGVTEL